MCARQKDEREREREMASKWAMCARARRSAGARMAHGSWSYRLSSGAQRFMAEI